MKRTLALGSLWTASAAAAVGLGFLAVSLVDADASPGTQPVAVTGSSSAADDRPSAAPATPPSSAATGEQGTVGGTAYASCDSGVPVLASAPAAGWWVDDSPEPGEIEFENGTQKVEVHVACGPTGPVFSVEGPRADSSGGGDDGMSPPAPPAASTAPSGDDSDGRGGGGHGSDDPPGDDSSGRDGGGHGSDN